MIALLMSCAREKTADSVRALPREHRVRCRALHYRFGRSAISEWLMLGATRHNAVRARPSI